MNLAKLENYFKGIKNIILIGKGSTIDQINFNNLSLNKKINLVININDSETIFKGNIAIISNNLSKKRFEKKHFKPTLPLYISDKKILNCKTLVINKNSINFYEPGLVITQILSNDVKFYDQAILTALHISSFFSRKFNKVFETYLLGFDFVNYEKRSKSSLDNSIVENKAYSNQILMSQYEYLKLLIPLRKNLKLNIKHVGNAPFSWITYKAFSKLFFDQKIKIKKINKNLNLLGSKNIYSNNYKVKVVAEITTNHFGDKDRLFAMINAAASAGADYVKFQRRNVDNFYNKKQLELPYKSPFGNNFRDYRLALELSDNDFKEIDALCKKINIGWFVSLLDADSYKSFVKFNPKIIKIPSTISEHKKYLNYISKNFKGSLVLSTGYTNKYYEKFILNKFINCKKIFLLQCVSAYPAPEIETNISVIKHYSSLSKKNNKIIPGYSSHDIGSLCSQLAIASGAKMIEKHVKFGDVAWAHFDDVAIDLADDSFINFVKDIRRAERILGSESKKIQPSENHKYWI